MSSPFAMNAISKNHLKELTKLNQKKYREQEQKVVVEGWRLIEQLLQNKIEIEEIFVSDPNILQTLPIPNVPITILEEWQLKKLTATQHPQNIAALVPLKEKQIIQNNFLLYLDNISDPGNLGAIFRTAAAAEIDGIVLSPECCEVFNPKVIRASLGSVFYVPFQIQPPSWLKSQDAVIISSCLQNSCNLTDQQIPEGKKILVLGSEAEGIRSEILQISHFRLRIPISGKIESLNVAVAAGILIFHLKNAC